VILILIFNDFNENTFDFAHFDFDFHFNF